MRMTSGTEGLDSGRGERRENTGQGRDLGAGQRTWSGTE